MWTLCQAFPPIAVTEDPDLVGPESMIDWTQATRILAEYEKCYS